MSLDRTSNIARQTVELAGNLATASQRSLWNRGHERERVYSEPEDWLTAQNRQVVW